LKPFYRIANTNLIFNAFGSEEAKPVQFVLATRSQMWRKKRFL